MKIPKITRLAGVDYETKWIPHLNNGTELCYGHISYTQSVIELSSTEDVGKQHECNTYLHEVLHGIIHHYKVPVGDKEEEIVERLSHGLYQFLQDNGAGLFDIKKK